MAINKQTINRVVSEIAGSDTIELINYLKDKKNISEFKIAQEVGKEINIIRNMLYRLYDANLVTFIRKKDKQKGWYIYYWTFDPKHIPHLVKHLKLKKLERLKERLKREKENDFYICKSNCIRLDFDQATDFGYKCPECGEIMYKENNEQKIKEIENEIKSVEKDKTLAPVEQKEVSESKIKEKRNTKNIKTKQKPKKKPKSPSKKKTNLKKTKTKSKKKSKKKK